MEISVEIASRRLLQLPAEEMLFNSSTSNEVEGQSE